MTNTNKQQIVSLTDAKILRGQQAWKKIKATAREQRELWREIGEALLVGRRLHKADQAFSRWLRENGFDDMKRDTRSSSMWLAENWTEVGVESLDTEVTHPVNIREWHRENLKSSPELPIDLQDLNVTPKPAVELDTRSAERIAKVINRAKAGGEGSDIAKKHVESIARKHGVTEEMLKESVAVTAPFEYHRFNAEQRQRLTAYSRDVKEDAEDMAALGISKEAIRHIFISIANQL